jgi:hypothetical protein
LVRFLASALLLGLVGLHCTACAGPAGGASGHRVLVRLYDAEDDVRLELANESHPELRDVYSRPREDAALKLAPDALMDDLLASIEQIHFEQLATPGEPPAEQEAAPRGLRGWVSVSEDGEQRTFLVPAQQPTAEQLQAYTRMKLVINHYYSQVGGLQFIRNPQGHELFEPRP